ncbi:hypothetical protein SOPP22_19545 [Shewanella sp. OPT22]|nr:hypothetical protein SOPP22_19545 [Shewanella sp. OPT22]
MPRITKLEDDIKSKVSSEVEYKLHFAEMRKRLKQSHHRNKIDTEEAVDAAEKVIELLFKRLKK